MKIGIDTVSIKRIKNILDKRPHFLRRVFSHNEILELERKKKWRYFESIAGKFAAKEAFIKATNKKNIALKSIEVLKDSNGIPYIRVPGFHKPHSLSITHEREFAIAVILIL